jgi:hypothetical protein
VKLTALLDEFVARPLRFFFLLGDSVEDVDMVTKIGQ